MSDIDLISLYSGTILALAANIPHLGRLEQAQARASRRSPLCGSSLSVEVSLDDARSSDPQVAAFAQEVRACALGQASAAILGQSVIGQSLSQLRRARSELAEMLAANGPAPQPPFEGYEVLRAAHAFANRHASILLALDATLAAIESAQSA